MKTKTKRGFTIVELLTVMAVIAVLIGLLIPALGMVKDKAKEVQQKAQFHSITVGVELFKSDFGSYPESKDNSVDTLSSPEKAADPVPYCGANKLAEAMVGLDYLGFHPNSDFRADGAATVTGNDGTILPDTEVYAADVDTANWQTRIENIEARKGPYMELETANAFAMDEIYTNAPAPFVEDPDTGYPLVLCDVYAKKRGGVGGKKAGSPILYYRARTQFVEQDLNGIPVVGAGTYTEADNDIYFYQDNDNLLSLGRPEDGTAFTLYGTGLANAQQNFEDMIVNEQVQTVRKPYRADSFILISAGKDGDFGTADDVFNFNKEIIE